MGFPEHRWSCRSSLLGLLVGRVLAFQTCPDFDGESTADVPAVRVLVLLGRGGASTNLRSSSTPSSPPPSEEAEVFLLWLVFEESSTSAFLPPPPPGCCHGEAAALIRSAS